MVPDGVKAGVLLVAGIGLLLNPVYFAPDTFDGSDPEVTYEVEPVPNETVAERVVSVSEQTLRCGTERACALELEIAEHGSVEHDGTIQEDRRAFWDAYADAWDRYTLVMIGTEYYVPEQEYTGNETVLTHRHVTPMEALEHIAIPADQTSPEVRETIESGSITLVDKQLPAFERGEAIEYEGDIYHVTRRTYSSDVGDSVLFSRIFLFLVGTGLVATAWIWRGRS